MKSLLAPALAILVTLPLLATAAELTINPGLWETKITRTNPMTGSATTNTNTECVKEETTFNPRSMLAQAKDCRVMKDDLDGDTLNFQMKCNVQGATTEVTGMYQAGNDSGKGNMEMKMNMGGMSMSMNMNWTAKRLGDCS